MNVNKLLEDLMDLLQTAPRNSDSALREKRVRELAKALEAHRMADLNTLLAAISNLSLPEARLSPEDLGGRIRSSLRDERAFSALLAKAAAPRAYSASDLIVVYNTALERRERFASKVSKKKILDQLRAEREIMLGNDFARETIIAHAKAGA